MRGATSTGSPSVPAESGFQSTLLMRGATRAAWRPRRLCAHFNPRSSCEERLDGQLFCIHPRRISIHAPHARSDCHAVHDGLRDRISIHAPHARSDSGGGMSKSSSHNFNPRSSCEERHGCHHEQLGQLAYFNPRSSCEERRERGDCFGRRYGHFNPRSSCEERQWRPLCGWSEFSYFNPRSSCEKRR